MASIGSGAVRAGRAFVELFTKNGALYRGLDAGRKRVEAWASAVNKVGIRAGIAGTAVVAPVLKMLGEFAGRGAAIKQIADRLGTTTESVSRLAYGFEMAGGNLEEFGGVVDGLAGKISRLQDSEEFFGEELRGLTGGMLRGKEVGDQLDLIAAKFATIKDAEDRARVAGELGLSRLLPWLKQGKAGLDAMRDAVPADGIITRDQAERSEELVKASNAAWLQLRETFFEIAKAVLPAADGTRTLSDQVGDLGERVRRWIQDNGGLIASVAAVGAGLLAGGVALKLFGTGLGVVATSLGVVSMAVKALGVALTFLTGGPIGLAVAAVAGLGVVLATQTETGREMVGTLGGLFTDLGETATTAWNGITDAIRDGDMEGAAEIAFKGLEAAWAGVVAAMTRLWNQFKRGVLDTGRDFMAGFKAGFSGDMLGGLLRGKGILGAVVGQANDPNSALNAAAEARAIQQKADDEARKLAEDIADIERENRQEELNILAAQQRARREAAREAARQPQQGGGREALPVPRMAQLQDELKQQMAQLYATAKGGFGGPVVQQFAYGDNIAKRQLDVQQQIGRDVAVLPALDQKVGAFDKAMRFGK